MRGTGGTWYEGGLTCNCRKSIEFVCLFCRLIRCCVELPWTVLATLTMLHSLAFSNMAQKMNEIPTSHVLLQLCSRMDVANQYVVFYASVQ